MNTRRQALIHGASAVAALGLDHMPAFAQAIPETLKIVVGFPPGGTSARSSAVCMPPTSLLKTGPARGGKSGFRR